MVGISDETGALIDRDELGRYKAIFKMGVVTVSPQHMILPPGTSVVVVGLENQVEFNNRLGTIDKVHRAAGRYFVDVGDAKISVKWENVRA